MNSNNAGLEVLIVGAGPVGLATSIELGRRGIRCRVIERNDRVGYSPRAKTTNVRTREHLRRWGIADTLRAASPIDSDRPSTVVFATRMNGPLLARFDNALSGSRSKHNSYSEEAQWVPQYVLEGVLQRYAETLPGVEIHFATEFVSMTQTADAVTSTIRDLKTGETTTVESAYLIGADGPRSPVRDAIGAKMLGKAGTSKNYSIVFRAPDLASRQIHERGIMYWMVNDDVPAMLGVMDEAGLWSFMATKLPGNVDPATLDPVDLIRRSTGLADLAVEIVGKDLWIANELVADHYAKGRVFLAGDACHLHPPFGGFGMNMGIGDGVDLAWKLAALLRGWGGETLLRAYEVERRQAHERTIAEAVINFATTGNQLVRPALEDVGVIGEATRREVGEIIQATKIREFRTLGIVLGMRYQNSPIVVPDGSEPPPEHFMLYLPSAHPGCLAPHLWLADGSSLYDHFGEGFTLLVAEGDVSAVNALVVAAARHGMPLKVLSLPDPRLLARYEARFTLIRPDQHVGWRGNACPADCAAVIAQLTGTTALPVSPADVARHSKSHAGGT